MLENEIAIVRIEIEIGLLYGSSIFRSTMKINRALFRSFWFWTFDNFRKRGIINNTNKSYVKIESVRLQRNGGIHEVKLNLKLFTRMVPVLGGGAVEWVTRGWEERGIHDQKAGRTKERFLKLVKKFPAGNGPSWIST